MRRKRIIAVVGLLLLVGVALLISYQTRQSSLPDFLSDRAKLAAYSNIVEVARHSVAAGAPLPSDGELAQIVRDPMEAPASSYQGVFEADSMKIHPAVKALGQAIVAKGKDAETRARYREAAADYVSVVELGMNYEHGPFIYFLVGAAIENIGMKPLRTVIPKLSDEEIAGLARRIQGINQERIPFNELMRREEYFAANNAQNIFALVRWRFAPSRRTQIAKIRRSHNKIATDCEGTAAAAAVLVYQRENSPALTNTEALVPKYLARVPWDEFADRPMRLRALPGGPVIYSVGENQRDEQGLGDDLVFSFADGVGRTNRMR